MPAVNLRHIEIFHAVMTTGNLTEAAHMLHTSQPTVSRELARFEKVLGLKLFERTRGRLHPTVQGLRLFEEVQRSRYGLDRIVSAAESLREFRGRAVHRLPAGLFPVIPAGTVTAVSGPLSGGQPDHRAAGVAAAGGVAFGPAPRSGSDRNPRHASGNGTHGAAVAG